MTVVFQSDAFIDGRWQAHAVRFPVIDPATQKSIAMVADVGAEGAKHAVAAAAEAFGAWSALLAGERARIMRHWFDLVMGDLDRIAALITLECGKPLGESRAEVGYGASFIEWYGEEAKRAYGRMIPTTVRSRRYLTMKQPIGVCAAITPWNFPLAMITRKAAPAIAAGNTIVVKPAAQTPLTALALAELADAAGLPRGVLNIITSDQAEAVGEVLCHNTLVRKVSFTGSTRVGKALGALCVGSSAKRISLELGGNAPLIVFADADIEHAVSGVLASKFRNAGQTCVCANRILVEDQIYDAFAERLADVVSKLQVGPGDRLGVDIGPLIDARALCKVDGLVRDALAVGARALTGAVRHSAGAQFYTPTVLSDVTPDMRVVREEIFGPVAPLVRFRTDDEAVRIANDTEYGLAAYVFTGNTQRAWRMAERLEYGMVAINDGALSSEVVPFGGVKESGLGREGGQEGLEEYLETRYVNFGGLPA
jgi:succinate-semialdehyde dehydrogenase/glutarate-semialdehyde dehydrogenase